MARCTLTSATLTKPSRYWRAEDQRLRDQSTSVQALPLAGLALRRGIFDGADRLAAHLGEGRYRDVAGRLRIQLLRASIGDDSNADILIDELERVARVQRSPIGLHCAALALRGVHRRSGLSAAVDAVPTRGSYMFSMLAEELARSNSRPEWRSPRAGETLKPASGREVVREPAWSSAAWWGHLGSGSPRLVRWIGRPPQMRLGALRTPRTGRSKHLRAHMRSCDHRALGATGPRR